MSDVTERERAARIREHLRARHPSAAPPVLGSIPPAGFLWYRLREARRIARFASSTGLIEFSLFRLKLRLVPGFRKTLMETWLAHCLPAHVCAEEILRDGWKWQILTVREYNHLVYFVDFCRKVQALERGGAVGSAPYRRMEEAFLGIVCREDYVPVITTALRKVLTSRKTKVPRSEEEQTTILAGLTCFFTLGCLKPGFYELIRARAMVGGRRYLEWTDLLAPGTNDFIQETYYDYPPEILGEIVGYLRSLDRQLERLAEEREPVAWIRDVAGASQGDPRENLAAYYARQGRDWEADSRDVLGLALSLVTCLTAGIDELAGGTWQVMSRSEKVGRATIIRDETLKRTIQGLRTEQDNALTLYKTTVPAKAPLTDFLIRGSEAAEITVGGRRVVFAKVSEILARLYQVALSLKRIRDDSVEGYGPGYYLSQMVVSPAVWRGKSLYDVLSAHIVLVIHACILFRIRSLEQDQARIDEIDRRVAALEATRRAVDPSGVLSDALRELAIR